MEDHWRPARTAAWETLLDLPQRTSLVYWYIVSGPHTGRTRICRVRLGVLAGAFDSSKPAIRRDLNKLRSEGLISLAMSGSVVEAYPTGSWVTCRPVNAQSRLAVARAMDRHGDGDAATEARREFGASGADDAEAIEKTVSRKPIESPSKAHPKPIVTDKQKQKHEEEQKHEEVDAPQASPPTLELTQPEKPKGKLRKRSLPKPRIDEAATAVLDLYCELCVPAGMKGMRKGANGYTPSMLGAAKKAMQRNGSTYDWREYFTFAAKSAFLTGKVAPTNGRQRFRAGFVWITGPQNQPKIEGGEYHEDERDAAAKQDESPWRIPKDNFPE